MAPFVANLPTEENPQSTYKVKVDQSSSSFLITIIHDNKAYTGEVTETYIAEQSKILNLSVGEYNEEFQKALKSPSEANPFTYSINNDYFHLKKLLKTSSPTFIKVKFGSVKLTQINFSDTVLDMLNVTLNENKLFLDKLQKLESDNRTLVEGNKMVLQQLKNLQETKNNLESSLYRQFMIVLNSKKERIRKLEEKLGMPVEEDDISDIEKEDEEIENQMPEDIYEVDTDIDEEPQEKPELGELKTENKDLEKNEKKPWDIKDFLNTKREAGRSDVQSILSFLDPTVPFNE